MARQADTVPAMIPSVGSVVGVVVVLVAAVVCGRFPLISNPGPESGMVLAVVGGVVLALWSAGRGARRLRSGFLGDFSAGVVLGAVYLAIFALVVAIGSVVTPSCSANAGWLPFLIVSVPVLLLHSALGACVGRLVGSRALAVGAVVVVELFAALSIAVDLLSEPGFRTASHFFVVLSSDLLAGAALSITAIGFRCITLLWALELVLVGAALWPAQKSRGLVSGAASDTLGLWVAATVVAVVCVVGHGQARAALIPGREALDEAYSLVKRRGPLVVHADPLSTSPREVDALLAEAALWLVRLEQRLGPLATDDIHIWAHHNREAMAAHTGAVHVDFALPWRRELHIGSTAVPHRTLGHELAHVVLGDRSDTMLRVPSRFIVLHNAAVTEGMAMALTPELAVDQGLTLREQAAAMRASGLSPQLSQLFSTARFFGEEPGRAYVAAGAFIEAIVAQAGDEAPRAIERLYRGAGELEAVSPDVEGLLADHERSLDAQPLPKDAVAYAAARFKRRSILDQVCEPEVVEVGQRMRRLARTGALEEAMGAAFTLEGDDADGTLSALLSEVRAVGDTAGALVLLRRLVELSPSSSERAVRQLALGDELWRGRQEREALALWSAIDERVVVENFARLVVAHRIFANAAVRLQSEAPIARAALAFFVAEPHLREGARLALARAIGAVTTEPAEVAALGRYVLARAFVEEGAVFDAIALLRPLVEGSSMPALFREQAVLALATALVRASALGSEDAAALTDAQAHLLEAAERASRPAMRLVLRERAERVARAIAAPSSPSTSTATTDPMWGDRLLLGAGLDGPF
jgi:hypothetical protein